MMEHTEVVEAGGEVRMPVSQRLLISLLDLLGQLQAFAEPALDVEVQHLVAQMNSLHKLVPSRGVEFGQDLDQAHCPLCLGRLPGSGTGHVTLINERFLSSCSSIFKIVAVRVQLGQSSEGRHHSKV